jgi:hypothetical protein
VTNLEQEIEEGLDT